VSAMVTTIYSR